MRLVLFWGGQYDPLPYFKKNLSNIKIGLYDC